MVITPVILYKNRNGFLSLEMLLHRLKTLAYILTSLLRAFWLNIPDSVLNISGKALNLAVFEGSSNREIATLRENPMQLLLGRGMTYISRRLGQRKQTVVYNLGAK